jgi:predicted CoA-binding protein
MKKAQQQLISNFFNLEQFAVVGASKDRSKFGNKVLRCYGLHQKTAIPINKKETEVEGIAAVKSLTVLAEQNPDSVDKTGVSIITPPAVTRLVLEEGISKGYRWFFLQPGTVDATVRNYMTEAKRNDPSINVIEDCVLVQLGCEDDI